MPVDEIKSLECECGYFETAGLQTLQESLLGDVRNFRAQTRLSGAGKSVYHVIEHSEPNAVAPLSTHVQRQLDTMRTSIERSKS